MVASPEIGYMAFRVHRPPTGEASDFGGGHGRLHCFRNVPSDLSLHGEDVTHLAGVSFGPEVLLGHRLHELGRDPDAVSRDENGSLDHDVHLQVASDLGNRFPRALEMQYRLAGNDTQCADVAQLCGQRVGDGVSEEILVGIVIQVFERKDSKRQGSGPNRRNARHEAIPTTGHGLDVGGCSGGVSQGRANTVDAKIQPQLEINECFVTPNRPADFLTGDQLASTHGQQSQDAGWLEWQLDFRTCSSELARAAVEFKRAESANGRRAGANNRHMTRTAVSPRLYPSKEMSGSSSPLIKN